MPKDKGGIRWIHIGSLEQQVNSTLLGSQTKKLRTQAQRTILIRALRQTGVTGKKKSQIIEIFHSFAIIPEYERLDLIARYGPEIRKKVFATLGKVRGTLFLVSLSDLREDYVRWMQTAIDSAEQKLTNEEGRPRIEKNY